MRLRIESRQSGDISVIDLTGHLVWGPECQELERQIRSLIAQDKNRILLNAEHVSFVDSSGLGELIASLTLVREHGGELKVVQGSNLLRDLVQATRLQDILKLYASETEALADFAESQ
jgi:anti-sigma B factor antagonist